LVEAEKERARRAQLLASNGEEEAQTMDTDVGDVGAAEEGA
jgi:hypothetical protein